MSQVYRISMHNTSLGRKPETAAEISVISANMAVVDVTTAQICEIVEAPHSFTITPKIFKANKPGNDTLISVTGFMLDFDLNSEPEEIISRFNEYGIYPNFYYTTHSDTKEYRKFRIGIMLDKELHDIELANLITFRLLHLFPADCSCKDGARIFWGGKKSYFLTEKPSTLSQLMACALSNITFDKVLKYDQSQKTVFLYYNNNRSTGFSSYTPASFEKGDSNDSSYLNKLKNNDFDFEKLKDRIRIYREFVDGDRRLDYEILLGLATSLHWTQGGIIRMKKIMQSYNDKVSADKNTPFYSEKHFDLIKRVKKEKLLPTALWKWSPYNEDHDYSNLITAVRSQIGKIEILDPREKININVAENLLEKAFAEALNSNDNDIHIIVGHVGLGKTMLLRSQENVTICGSTHKLISELATKMLVDVHVVPELPKFSDETVNAQISYYYNSGLGYKSRRLIGEIALKLGSSDAQLAIEYLSKIEEAKNTSKTLLTTHQRAIFQDSIHDTIIFDEDCINSLLSNNSFDLDDLLKIINENDTLGNEFNDVYLFLKSVERDQLNKSIFKAINPNVLWEILGNKKDLVSNIIDFFYSDEFIVEEFETKYGKKIIVNYSKYRDFPSNKKIIILSATINVELYKMRFGNKVKVYEIPEVENIGSIIQHTRFSNSRQSINNRSKDNLLKKVGSDYVITFKDESKIFNDKYFKRNTHIDVYFGNCRGYNLLSGKNISVIGTYQPNPLYYYFLMRFARIEFDLEVVKKIKNQVVTWKGMRFIFHAYENEDLRQIQFACIEGELIQAVGRARTIRYDCTVNLHSNFPLSITDKFNHDDS